MKAKYLNPVIVSLSNVLESMAQIVPTKGSIDKKEKLVVEKDYTLLFRFEGELNGFFAFSFDEKLALEIVNRMTGGMVSGTELDEVGLSAMSEVGGMVKGSAESQLQGLGYTTSVSEVQMLKKEEVPEIEEESILKLEMKTDFGDIDLHIFLQ